MSKYSTFFGLRGRFGNHAEGRESKEHWHAYAGDREGPREAQAGGSGHRPRQTGGRGGGGRGGPFGFGGGGFFGGFPGPFGRPPRARRGDVRAGILALLAEAPRNGYQIMQELEARSRGMWRPSPGSVYPALQQLEDEGLVRAEEAGTGRVYQLTEQGRAYVAEHKDETAAPWEWQGSAESEEAFDLMGQVRHIAGALWQIASAGEPGQIAEARKVLSETRRALYAILAKDSDDDE
jgi:DNA-binding PadR family transcriptional regulator